MLMRKFPCQVQGSQTGIDTGFNSLIPYICFWKGCRGGGNLAQRYCVFFGMRMEVFRNLPIEVGGWPTLSKVSTSRN